ncbi:hypothetical protein Aspvir_009487 [Aspergillus viridinutans]|uniref:Uncharacterized protein n=1 Tax=Aspergillus viridinutans TaxID=75553 RepID=A0A9P3BZK3_ASPVI|nr:uncharacterized protein Aspvir_009487 [Aspergillus viridinutans]GIK05378.1 hypothetical protein Aspvir_009487 [Aspergillus viridinutans]
MQQARKIATRDENLIQSLRVLKGQHGNGVLLCAMLNISSAHYAAVRHQIAEWAIFDRVFTSGETGMRKPDLCFYRHVLSEIRQPAEKVIFVESNPEDVLPARSIGSRVVLHTQASSLHQQLQNLLADPIERGNEFLRVNAKRLDSVTDTGVTIRDNFTQLLVLEATKNRDLIYLEEHPRTWNFFIGKSLLTSSAYPDDFDTTSTALTVLEPDRKIQRRHCSGILLTMQHFRQQPTNLSWERRTLTALDRVDPVVCVNVLRVFYKHGRGHELQNTLHWVRDVLKSRAYIEGTRYYPTPEAFLYFLGRLLESANDVYLHRELFLLLRERVQERVGLSGDALCLAMRLLTCQYVGITDEADLAKLCSMQCEDGGWEPGWVYRYGKTDVRIGNRGLATALAVNALSQAEVHKTSRDAGLKRQGVFSISIPTGFKSLYWALVNWMYSYRQSVKISS